MKRSDIKITDGSGDKKYFTIIPNYVLNHSTAIAQALYLQLKRLAGEDGIAYPASRYLRERLCISQPTLRKEFIYLLEKGWIRYEGEKEVDTDGGKQKIKSYKISDLWETNSKFYSRGERIDTPQDQRGERIDTQGVKTRGERIGTKEEPSEEELSFNKNNVAKPSFAGEIAEIINLFKDVNPSYKKLFANNTQRACLERMLKEHGMEKIKWVMGVLPKSNGMQYAPTITTPLQLEDKLGNLIAFMKKKQVELPSVAKI